MKRLLMLAVLVGLGLANGGCMFSNYGSDPNTRTESMLNDSENLRQVRNEWRRIWMNDQPSHLTPERVNGGIQ